MSKVGFIGLGIMGAPMAGHLIAGGHALFLYSRRPPKAELIDKGAVACASAKEVAERSDIVIIVVPDTPDVAAVLFSETGVAAGLSKGKIVVDMSMRRESQRSAAIIWMRRFPVARSARRRPRSRSWWAGTRPCSRR